MKCQRRRIKIVLFLMTVTVVCLIAVYIIHSFYNRRKGFENLESLLHGDKTIAIDKIIIQGQGVKIYIQDDAAAKYLTTVFRHASRDGYVPSHPGITYTGQVVFRCGLRAKIGIEVPDEKDGITISFPLDTLGDPEYYWIKLTRPQPESVEAAIRKLR